MVNSVRHMPSAHRGRSAARRWIDNLVGRAEVPVGGCERHPPPTPFEAPLLPTGRRDESRQSREHRRWAPAERSAQAHNIADRSSIGDLFPGRVVK